jgi:hypothetical protein
MGVGLGEGDALAVGVGLETTTGAAITFLLLRQRFFLPTFLQTKLEPSTIRSSPTFLHGEFALTAPIDMEGETKKAKTKTKIKIMRLLEVKLVLTKFDVISPLILVSVNSIRDF